MYMYYFCRQDLFKASNIIEIVGHTPITGAQLWTAGQKFTVPIPSQILQLDTCYGTDFPAFFDTTIPVMSHELILAFHDAGVDNFDEYPMVLKRMDTGEEYTNFKAVNFIGSIDCIDMDNSIYQLEDDEPEDFESIVIDERKTYGEKVFRLSVGPDFLVIHKDIAEQLSKKQFKALLLQKTEEYTGI